LLVAGTGSADDAGRYRTGLLWATAIAVAAALVSLLVKPVSDGTELRLPGSSNPG
jgi:hypothetical protein